MNVCMDAATASVGSMLETRALQAGKSLAPCHPHSQVQQVRPEHHYLLVQWNALAGVGYSNKQGTKCNIME